MKGKGWAGSTASGVTTGKILFKNVLQAIHDLLLKDLQAQQ